jgi:hypothetical protein
VAISLDLAVGDAEAAEELELVGREEREIDFGSPELELVDRRDHPQQAEGAGEELEELVVVDRRVEQRAVDQQAATQIIALDPEFEGARDLLVVLVVDVDPARSPARDRTDRRC